MTKEENIQVKLEHYKELNSTGRHYDQQFWVLPGASYTLSIILYGGAFSKFLECSILKTVVLWLVPIITLGFIIQMVNERAYHLKNKMLLKSLRKALNIEDQNIEIPKWAKWWTKNIDPFLLMTLIISLVCLLQAAIALISTFM